jgi:hypothetical protein
LANSSPGIALKSWVSKVPQEIFATLKGLRLALLKMATQLFQSCVFEKWIHVPQGCQKRNPGAGISERFQHYSSYFEFSHSLYREAVLTLSPSSNSE